MSNNHGHGFRGYIEMLLADGSTWLNITPHVPSFNSNATVDTAEDTGMQPTGDYKTFLQGLRTGTSDFTVNLENTGALKIAITAILNKANRDGTVLREFPFGKTSGYYYQSLPVLFTNPGSISTANSGAVTMTVGTQVNAAPTEGLWA